MYQKMIFAEHPPAVVVFRGLDLFCEGNDSEKLGEMRQIEANSTTKNINNESEI